MLDLAPRSCGLMSFSFNEILRVEITMSVKTKIFPAAVAIAVILGSGYVHGLWSFRWTAASELKTAAEKMTKVPKVIGDWTGEDSTLDQRQATIGRIYASVSRHYKNSKTGQSITILLLCGRPGPIAVHTPDVCYSGSGYEVAADRTKESVDYGMAAPAQFWSLKVHKLDPTRPERMVIDYGWFSQGKWSAPGSDARFEFAGRAVLYKLYVIREQTRADERGAFDPTVEFLKEFLPSLQEVLGSNA